MANFRSITQIGTSEPFELQVARGQVPGHSVLHKFGAVPSDVYKQHRHCVGY